MACLKCGDEYCGYSDAQKFYAAVYKQLEAHGLWSGVGKPPIEQTMLALGADSLTIFAIASALAEQFKLDEYVLVNEWAKGHAAVDRDVRFIAESTFDLWKLKNGATCTAACS